MWREDDDDDDEETKKVVLLRGATAARDNTISSAHTHTHAQGIHIKYTLRL